MKTNAVRYFEENKGKYERTVLVRSLLKHGYLQAVVEEAEALVYGKTLPSITASQASATSFWDFKSIKAYGKPEEKWLDFLFGIIGVPIAGVVIVENFDDIFWLAFLLYIVALVMLKKRRRYLFYGLLLAPVAMIFIYLNGFEDIFDLSYYF